MTQEQMQQFEAVVNEFEKLRSLTPEEKELLIRHIMSGTFMDLRCDWALSSTCDNAHYYKYIVITSQTSRLFTKR